MVAAGARDDQLPFLLEQVKAKWMPSALRSKSVFSVGSENPKRAAGLRGVCRQTIVHTRSVLKGKLTFLTNGTILLLNNASESAF